MKRFTILAAAAALAQMAGSAGAATVNAQASYQLRNFTLGTGITGSWDRPTPLEETSFAGTGTASTTYQSGGVSASAATSGRSGVAMDFGNAQAIGRETLTLTNTGAFAATFGGGFLPSLFVSIIGNNDGELTPEGLLGELATAVAAVNIFQTIFRTDGTQVEKTLINATYDLGFGETGVQQGTGGGSGGWVFVSGLNPGERAELTFEISAIANAWHADEVITTPELPPVPLPAGIVLLPSAFAAIFGLRRRRRRACLA